MRTAFDEKRAADAAATLLESAGGRMSYMKLIKLLYIADRIALTKVGRPITGDQYYSMKRGPVLSTVLNLVRFGDKLFPPHKHWSSLIEKSGEYDVRLKGHTDAEHLSEVEQEILKKVARRFKGMSQWDMVEYCHKHFREWTDPGRTSTRITHEQILHAAGKSDEEILDIREDLEHAEYVRSVLNCQ